MRTLTTVEKHGTKINHKKCATSAEIIGTTFGGFTVYTNDNRTCKLKFSDVENWEVAD